MARVKAKREEKSITPENTANLTKQQQQQSIAEADLRRKKAKEEN